MSGPATQFRDALREVVGLTKQTNVQYLTGAIQQSIAFQPVEIYSIHMAASAAVAVDLRFDDVSATGLGVTGKFALHFIPAGITSINFERPLGFDKGFVINYTASGAANIDMNVIYSPRPDPFARALY